jgi:hypothetical protein
VRATFASLRTLRTNLSRRLRDGVSLESEVASSSTATAATNLRQSWVRPPRGYQLYLPIFGWYGPGGTYTEGSGVQPDLPIDIDPNRLAYGEDAQVNKALELLE